LFKGQFKSPALNNYQKYLRTIEFGSEQTLSQDLLKNYKSISKRKLENSKMQNFKKPQLRGRLATNDDVSPLKPLGFRDSNPTNKNRSKVRHETVYFSCARGC